MKWRKDNDKYLLRLDKDELLVESLVAFAKEVELESAWISGLGGVQWVDLGYYHLERREYNWHRVPKLLELAASQGNITIVEGEPFVHLHGSFSGPEFETYAGHIKEASIGGTGEFLVVPFSSPIGRQLSDDIGLKLLDV